MLLFVFYLQSLRPQRPLRFNFMFLFEEAAEKDTVRWTVSGNSGLILLSQQHCRGARHAFYSALRIKCIVQAPL
jgi:hypothetical protein